MLQSQGWVKFYRQFYSGSISCKPRHYREVFIWLIAHANHKPARSSGRLIQRGQLVRSYKDICDALCWYVGARKERYKEHHIGSAMNWFRKEGMIKTTKTSRGLIITVCRYDYYQREDFPKVVTKALTKAPVKRQEASTINKNERIKEKDIPIIESDSEKIPFAEFWDAYDLKVGLKSKITRKWDKLSDLDRQQIMDFIPKYKEARPDKQFRRNPDAFMNNRIWEDEIVVYEKRIETKEDLSVFEF